MMCSFLVVFISTCLVTVTPQCILFSEMIKKDSKVKLEIVDTLLRCPLPFLVPTLGFFPCATQWHNPDPIRAALRLGGCALVL
jgi:hypothetical protein